MARTTGSRKDNPEARMALGEHLRELRKRVMLATGGILVGAVLGWFLYDSLTIGPISIGALTIGPIDFVGVFGLLREPIDALKEVRGDDIVTLNFGTALAAFDVRIRVTLFTGLFLTSPWWLYQIFAFIVPGLTKKEKQYTFGFLGAAVVLFLSGSYVAWSVLPKAMEVLVGELTPDGTTNIQSATDYLKFVMQFVVAFGIAFLLPLIMVALNFMGIVKGVTWLKGWRWAIIGIFAFCAFATPNPEPTAMIFMALPIIGLYFIAVLVSHLHDKRVEKRRAAEDAELAADRALTDTASDTTEAKA